MLLGPHIASLPACLHNHLFGGPWHKYYGGQGEGLAYPPGLFWIYSSMDALQWILMWDKDMHAWNQPQEPIYVSLFQTSLRLVWQHCSSMPPMSQDTCHFSGFTVYVHISGVISLHTKGMPKGTAHWNKFPLAARKGGKRNGQAFHRRGQMNVIRKRKITSFNVHIMPPDCWQFKSQCPYTKFYWHTAMLIHLHIVSGCLPTPGAELCSCIRLCGLQSQKCWLSAPFLEGKVQEKFKLN